jgi:hypothetical protein
VLCSTTPQHNPSLPLKILNMLIFPTEMLFVGIDNHDIIHEANNKTAGMNTVGW